MLLRSFSSSPPIDRALRTKRGCGTKSKRALAGAGARNADDEWDARCRGQFSLKRWNAVDDVALECVLSMLERGSSPSTEDIGSTQPPPTANTFATAFASSDCCRSVLRLFSHDAVRTVEGLAERTFVLPIARRTQWTGAMALRIDAQSMLCAREYGLVDKQPRLPEKPAGTRAVVSMRLSERVWVVHRRTQPPTAAGDASAVRQCPLAPRIARDALSERYPRRRDTRTTQGKPRVRG